MKIAHISWSMTNGGIENMLSDIINCQVSHCDVSLIVINDAVDETILNRIDKRCHVIRIGRKLKGRNPWFIIKLNYLLWKGCYDILHVHNDGFLKYMFYRGRRIATIHNSGFSSLQYSGCKVLACISQAVYDEMTKAGYKNCVRVDNGINVQSILQRRIDFYEGKLKMVQVSRLLLKQKGQDILLKALSLLKHRGQENFTLDFIGSGVDEVELKQMVVGLNLEKHVRFLGNQSREYVYSHLKDYDLFVQPSRFEGFGLTVAEAMAACVPVLVSKNEGPLEIIDYGKYGYDFENGDIHDCAEKIALFLWKKNDLTLVQKALQHVSDRYNIETTVRQYLMLYGKMLR